MPEHVVLVVSITRWVDDEPQPGIVEFEFSDRFGRLWRFHEKQSLVSSEWLDANCIYPRSGDIRCLALSQSQDQYGRLIAKIDTSQPYSVESLEEVSRFEVFASQLLPGA
ncbi:MAG: hypothetical protein EOS58_08450 [Mesorhizobium sp.]|uniref:hypothetical protein n=1 Tax=unclassified Mesorhizobium TaxID=325217 RepID=UPI000F754D52|nr:MULTISPECIES: hypothetical protein [unclassified Mesorhizobium]AZO50507.1 hypothetical protein EJ073_24415 [Mesorhizobium sp. M4B.F.Ca.ET.058.02.1.1]RUX50791.1 hypothetical protein EOA33_08440 [Mesorhizobium sp. M4A.F.Ca.ET.050.02.1.1]RVC46013.1 hypothetical protein EN781_07390 [Mesorhizobium sp. M4A.F.Ca.ET.090.04.2.1]RVD41525.1 hypothetical protein EN742_09910 [Mesorhizobium sp. M4A.F.Ca.ET.020.02.1.1]RWC14019.1 MAG: hypothetical protein EOS53_23360 [Mesorhizobium sp.]